MDNVIEVSGLRKAYGSLVAVEDVSFSVRRGEIFGILGPNGAGKTTTVESIAGLRRPDAGTIRVLGLDPERDGRQLRQRLGVQLQQATLPERLKVWEALELFASFYKAPADWRRLLGQWDLTEKRNASFADLSGGQRQRLFIALALVGDPEVVILDELTSGLDPQARRATWELVGAVRDAGTTLPILWNSAGREYNPDFIVIEDDGTHWIVEVKMNKEMTSADVLGKREAAKRWANYVTADERVGVTWRYLLASESDIDDAKGSWSALKKLGS